MISRVYLCQSKGEVNLIDSHNLLNDENPLRIFDLRRFQEKFQKRMTILSVPKLTQVGRMNIPTVIERTMVKELGKLTL